jgi:hypothetical protein
MWVIKPWPSSAAKREISSLSREPHSKGRRSGETWGSFHEGLIEKLWN